MENIKGDLERYAENSNLFTFMRMWVTSVGFRAVFYLRLQNFFYAHRRKFYLLHLLAHYMRGFNVRNYGLDACFGNVIGPGLRIEHPVGIVIGGGSIIGRNATILQGVTIGEKYVDVRSNGRYPTIGDNVAIGAHSAVLGGIHIGNNVTLGAHSLVLRDVEDNCLVVGLHN